jgi:hypothetical protein
MPKANSIYPTRHVRSAGPAVHLAQALGAGLAAGKVLLGSLPPAA